MKIKFFLYYKQKVPVFDSTVSLITCLLIIQFIGNLGTFSSILTLRDKTIDMYVNFWFLCKDMEVRYTANETKNRKSQSQSLSACYTPIPTWYTLIYTDMTRFLYTGSIRQILRYIFENNLIENDRVKVIPIMCVIKFYTYL